MLDVTFIVDETGVEYALDAEGHSSLMHLAVENDVPNIEGECGGEMTCGTCHVYLDKVPGGYDPPKSADEADMLEVVNEPTEASRLSCQLVVNDNIGGLVVRVPAI